jgi:hypothetical protein
MTGMSDFTETEYRQVLQGPPSAGMIMVTAAKGGKFRETFAIGKAYAEADDRALPAMHRTGSNSSQAVLLSA